jgi:acetyl-CoA acetyltransferase
VAVQHPEHLPGHRRRRRRHLTRADRAKDLRKKPVYVRGAGEGSEHVMLTQMRNLTFSEATQKSGEKAFAMAGVKPTELRSHHALRRLHLGPAAHARSARPRQARRGRALLRRGRSTPGGKLPINTNGGGLSYTHSGMYGIFPIIEAARQLRGECGPRQVPGASLSLVNGMGGMLSAAGTLVLSSDASR